MAQLRSSSLSSAESPSPSQVTTPTSARTDSRLMTHFPKSFDHMTLTQSTEETDEHAIFTRSLMSGGRHGKEGRFRRGASPLEEDLVAGRGGKFSSYSPRIRDDSLVSLPDSREDPDGQSDISSISPEAVAIMRESTPDTPVEVTDTPSICSLTPPPSTPLTANGNSFKPTITPVMIQSALTALQQIQNKDTPISTGGTEERGHSPIFPEEVTTALTAWINQQHNRSAGSSELQTPLLSPPPSTPQKTESESDNLSVNVNFEGLGGGGGGAGPATTKQGISASDLIAALSSLMAQDSATDATSGESSGVCSVPACTPKEGFTEWLRLGIHPDEVIQALTALTISRAEQEVEGEEEGAKVTRPSQQVTLYQEFPPSIEISGASACLSDGEGRGDEEKEASHQTSVEKAVEKVEADNNTSVATDQREAEEGERLEEDLKAELIQSSQENDPPTSEANVNDMSVPSEEVMGIALLNELSFFPDPLAAGVVARNERDIPSETHNDTVKGENSDLPADQPPLDIEPSSSPLESVLYLDDDVDNM